MLACCRQQKQLMLLLLTIIAYVTNTITLVECQDSSFDQDLSQQHPSATNSFLLRQPIGSNNNNQQQQHSVNSRHQHQLSRLSAQQQQIQASSSNVNLQAVAAAAPAPQQPTSSHPHRPLLSSRFSAAQAALGASASTFVPSQQPLTAAASAQSTQSTPNTQSQQQQSRQASSAPTSNIEQLMKSAISRSSEPVSRQTQLVAVAPIVPAPAPVAAAQTAAQQQAQPAQQETDRSQPVESPSVKSTATTNSGDSNESGATTTGGQADSSVGAHETVYSDQRFANLFARRQNLRKSRLVPTEQAKAKPTLPSFIKSLPDPKQFPSTPTADQERALNSQLAASSGNAFLSQRVQAANQKALGLQQSSTKVKPNISSSNGNISKIKPNAKSPTQSASSKPIKSSSSDSGSSSGRPRATPNNPGNPFAAPRPNTQTNSSESIIANARKRLLANNALEAAKLKKAEQSQ